MRIDFSEINSKVKLYLSVGRHEAAEKLLLSTLDEHGSLANLHNLLGVTYHQQSKFADAVIHFTKALKINNSYVEAGLNLAATFCDLGRYDDAKAVFSEVIAVTPPNKRHPDLIMGRLANHHSECGRLYEQSGFLNEALLEYKKAVALYDRLPDVRIAIGKIYFRMNQYDRSLNELQSVVSQFPNEHEAHLWSGIAHWKLGNHDLAETQWKSAYALTGESGPASGYLRLVQNMKNSPRS